MTSILLEIPQIMAIMTPMMQCMLVRSVLILAPHDVIMHLEYCYLSSKNSFLTEAYVT